MSSIAVATSADGSLANATAAAPPPPTAVGQVSFSVASEVKAQSFVDAVMATSSTEERAAIAQQNAAATAAAEVLASGEPTARTAEVNYELSCRRDDETYSCRRQESFSGCHTHWQPIIANYENLETSILVGVDSSII